MPKIESLTSYIRFQKPDKTENDFDDLELTNFHRWIFDAGIQLSHILWFCGLVQSIMSYRTVLSKK